MQPGRPPIPDRHADAHADRTARAGAVVRGLLRTRRARPRLLSETGDQVAEFARLERRDRTGYYWISRAGDAIRVGSDFVASIELQQGFADAMARVGSAQ
jgi:hypothetical protein